MRYIKYMIFLVLLILSAFSFQKLKQPELYVEGTVVHYGKPLNGAVITVILNSKQTAQLVTSNNGKFSLSLNYQEEYILEVVKENYVTKKVAISTDIPNHVYVIGGVTEGFTDLVIPMLEKIPGMNTTPFNKPVTRFIFDEPTWLFIKDEELTKKVAPQINPIINKLDDLRQEAYQKQIRLGDSLINTGSYEAAYMAYQKSAKYTDDEKYAKAQMKKAYKAIKRNSSIDEEYNKVVAEGNTSLKNENFNRATEYFEKALMYKPEDIYATRKIQEVDSMNNQIFFKKKVAFDTKVMLADSLNKHEKYDEAHKYYREALTIFPNEQDIQTKYNENEKALKSQPVPEEKPEDLTQSKYNALIISADSLYELNKYSKAEQLYSQAEDIKPGEKYPQKQIDEIKRILEKQKKEEDKLKNEKAVYEQNSKYNEALELADNYFDKGKYELSVKEYKNALKFKPEENYPKQKIAKATKHIQAQNEENQVAGNGKPEKENTNSEYRLLIVVADDAFRLGEYSKALENYNQAKKIKPDETYPDNKIQEIKALQEKSSESAEPDDNRITSIDTGFSKEAHQKRVQFYLKRLESKKVLGDEEGQISILRSLGEEYHLSNEIGKAIKYYEEALEINKKTGNREEASNVLNDMAVAFYDSGRYEAAVDLYIQSYEINERLGDKEKTAELLDNIGQVYENTYNYENALKFYEKSLDVVEELGKDEEEANLYDKIADVYYEQNDLNNAITSYEKSLAIDQKLEKKERIGITLNNIGSAHYNLGNYVKAGEYYEQSLDAADKAGDKKQQAITLNNIGNINFESKRYNRAIDYYKQSVSVKQEINYNEGVSVTLHNIGNAFRELKKEDNAVDYYQQSLKVAKEIDYGEVVARNYKALAEVYSVRKDYRQAYDYQKKYEDYRSSESVKLTQITETLRSSDLEEREKTIVSLRRQVRKQKLLAKYEAERRIKDIEIKNLELKSKDEAIKRQKLVIYSGIIGTLGLLAILVLIIRQNIIKRRNNKMLVQKNELISFQKQQITDSIKYASRIQKAMLPPSEYIHEIVPQHFILNRPRDIVSGDYYWTTQRGDESIVAVADCTGHGVPGAFMSMLGIAFLNEIVNKKVKARSNEILDELRRHVIQQLHQKGKDAIAKDGMDIALCIINTNERKLQYSGAHNPLFIVRKGELIEVKADKMPIGIGFFERTEVPFKYHDVKLRKGDMIYIFSDGYADQFGSENKKKFGIRRFKELLIEVHQKSVSEQHDILQKSIFDWKGDYEQIDDIMVMGVRID